MNRHVLQLGEYGPQRGPQETFLASPASFTVYGGAAGGGKTWSLLYALARWVALRGFIAIVFRKYMVDIKQAGGLWSEAEQIYPLLGGQPNRHDWEWRFPSGAIIKMAAIDRDYQTRFQGAQAAVIAFDEVTHFAEEEVFFFLSRNRTKVPGLRARMLATCNPDADSWVAKHLSWYWDPSTGLNVPARSGVVRWFLRVKGPGGKQETRWAASREQLLRDNPGAEPAKAKSFTFVPAALADNRYLAGDGEYRGNLLQLDEVQQQRLLFGNWLIRYKRGSIFRRTWFKRCSSAPEEVRWWRIWDLAATSEAQANGSTSSTCGLKIGEADGRVYIGGMEHGRWDSGDVELLVKKTAKADGPDCRIWLCRERAGAGKAQLGHYARLLRGYVVDGDIESGEKELRLGPVASQVKHGNVYVVDDGGEWVERFLDLAEELPARPALDMGDALSAGFQQLEFVEQEAEESPALADRDLTEALEDELDPDGILKMDGW